MQLYTKAKAMENPETPEEDKDETFYYKIYEADKIGNIEAIKNKIIEFEFKNGKFEDIKMINATINDEFHTIGYQLIAGIYKIRIFVEPFNTHPQILMRTNGVQSVIQIIQCPKKELFLDKSQNVEVISKLVFKMPGPNNKVKNLNIVLRNANRQLVNGGDVFLHVPFLTFANAKSIVQKELSLGLSNIAAVKLISLEVEEIQNTGVKISRNEELIISNRAFLKLTEKETEFHSNPISFSKFK